MFYALSIEYIPAERILTSLLQSPEDYSLISERKSEERALNFFQKFFDNYSSLKSKLASIKIDILNIRFSSIDKKRIYITR